MIRDSFKSGGIAGIGITVSEKGKHTHFSEGYADYKAKIPVDQNTVFPIASCTKSFFAMAVASLDAKGIIGLDVPIREYYSELSMVDKYAEANVTLRDLLCHRWGMPRHDVAWFVNLGNGLTEDELVAKVKYLPPFSSFRSKWAYTNIGYVLAGHVVKRACGKSWDTLVKDEIIKKLGIKDISFDKKGLSKLPNKAFKYKAGAKQGEYEALPFSDYDVMGPASCISISTAELIKWTDAQMGYYTDGMKKLNEKALKVCHTPQMAISDTTGNDAIDMRCFGLGWGMQRYKGQKIISHSGAFDSFLSTQFFLPDTGFSAAVAMSATTSKQLMNAHMYALIDLHLGHDTSWDEVCKWVFPEAETGSSNEVKTFTPALELDNYIGEYENKGYGTISVNLKVEVKSDEKSGKQTGKKAAKQSDKQIDAKSSMLAVKIGTFELLCEHITQNNFILRMDGIADINFPLQFIVAANGTVIGMDVMLEPMLEAPIHFNIRSKK